MSNKKKVNTEEETPQKRYVYDIISKTFIEYKIYMESYNIKMYGEKQKNENINLNIIDDIKYFD